MYEFNPEIKDDHVSFQVPTSGSIVKSGSYVTLGISKGVPPRAEINSADQAKEYLDMGVRHFSVGTDISILFNFWKREGELILRALKEIGRAHV